MVGNSHLSGGGGGDTLRLIRQIPESRFEISNSGMSHPFVCAQFSNFGLHPRRTLPENQVMKRPSLESDLKVMCGFLFVVVSELIGSQ